jgi:uncharacterized protein YdhG (YjbR/CyaY superfamily)
MRLAKTKEMETERRRLRAYFASLSATRRRALKRLRATIRAAAPGAVEAFSYAMPVFRLDGRILVWYAAFRAHCSLYPMSAVLRAHAGALKGYKTSRGTIQFPLADAIPTWLVERLIRARIKELRTRHRDRRTSR